MDSPVFSMKSSDIKNALEPRAEYIRSTENELEEAVMKQIEAIRISEGLSSKDFASLIGLTYAAYNKAANGSRRILLKTFITICRIFGYDLNIIQEAALNNSNETVYREIGPHLGALKPETIDALNETLQNSDESDEKKRICGDCLKALSKAAADPNNHDITFFLADIPEKVAQAAKEENFDEDDED